MSTPKFIGVVAVVLFFAFWLLKPVKARTK